MEKVSACLIVWKRQHNLPQIIESLTKWPFISEILIRDNSKSENLKSFGRYVLAEKASNKIIFTQDDDCIIKNLDEVYEKFISDPGRICHGGTEEYEKVIKENIYGEAQMAMAGWGFFFNKYWIDVLDKYVDKYGKDDCFYRETDRIFSMLRKQHHNFVLGDIEHINPTDEFAMSNQPEHLQYKKIAIDRCLSIINEKS